MLPALAIRGLLPIEWVNWHGIRAARSEGVGLTSLGHTVGRERRAWVALLRGARLGAVNRFGETIWRM